MNSENLWLIVPAIAALAGALCGVLAMRMWAHRQQRRNRRIPREWPLNPRLLVNSEERFVWNWLRHTFHDHQVMLKLPVTRFTLPRNAAEGQYWYKLLSNVYCTYTICGTDGHVAGCIDLDRRELLSSQSRKLKQTLLSQSGIGYWVMSSAALPSGAELRLELLGEPLPVFRDGQVRQAQNDQQLHAARASLHATIGRSRLSRHSDLAPWQAQAAQTHIDSSQLPQDSQPLPDAGFNSGLSISRFSQANSFLAPLDSRRVQLR